MKKTMVISISVIVLIAVIILVTKYRCSVVCGMPENKNTPSTLQKDKVKGLQMIKVKGGEFMMGCTEVQANCDPNEYPAHKVKVSSFLLSKTEITVSEFAQFVKETGYITTAESNGGGYIYNGVTEQSPSGIWKHDSKGKEFLDFETCDFPVINVSWYDAVAFCKWAGGRLPTEAEWEFAARGGVKSKNTRFCGSSISDEVGWFDKNSGNTVHPVAQKKANELGFYDMGGNVWEWCADWYEKGYYSLSPEENPEGLSEGKMRVVRGGCWSYFDIKTRVSNRSYDVPDSCLNIYGFRMAAD